MTRRDRSEINSAVLPGPRRAVRREMAAQYAGVSPSKFDELVRTDRMPKPFRVDGCVLWDIRDLDFAIDALKNASLVPESGTSWDDR